MSTRRLSHLSDRALLDALTALVAKGCENTAATLAHLAEVDARKLYLGEGYPKLHIYCVEGLHLSGDSPKRDTAGSAAIRITAHHEPASSRPSANPRQIPPHVKMAVWQRDQGQCSFVSEAGHRCAAREPLEFDHMQEVARGGESTVENLRLLCRGHNQYAAECSLGAGFMEEKRRHAMAVANARAVAKAHASVAPETENGAEATLAALAAGAQAAVLAEQAPDHAAEREIELDLLSGLRNLGFRGEDLRRASELCKTMPDTSLSDRMHAALQALGRRVRRGLARPQCALASRNTRTNVSARILRSKPSDQWRM